MIYLHTRQNPSALGDITLNSSNSRKSVYKITFVGFCLSHWPPSRLNYSRNVALVYMDAFWKHINFISLKK